MTIFSTHKSPLTMTGLAVAAAVAFSGMMMSGADASTRVNQKTFKMSQSQFFKLCAGRKAVVQCPTSNVMCNCEDRQFRWVYQPPTRQVVRMPSPSRVSSAMSLEGGDGGGRGGRGGKP